MTGSEPQITRSELVRDTVLLQGKLFIDGFRDLMLVPISLAAALLSLLRSGSGGVGHEFYEVVRLGRRSERWINLFGAADRLPGSEALPSGIESQNIDVLVTRLETSLREQYEQGGITGTAKVNLERAITRLRRLSDYSAGTSKRDR